MTGSSARKLRRTSANLLGGRAWPYALFPLTIQELGRDFDLGSVLRFGSLPPVIGRPEGLCRWFLELAAQPTRGTSAYGRLFEQFIVLELKRLLTYRELDRGATIRPTELSGLRSFRGDHPDARLVCVADIDRPFSAGGIECLPWRSFFDQVASSG